MKSKNPQPPCIYYVCKHFFLRGVRFYKGIKKKFNPCHVKTEF